VSCEADGGREDGKSKITEAEIVSVR